MTSFKALGANFDLFGCVSSSFFTERMKEVSRECESSSIRRHINFITLMALGKYLPSAKMRVMCDKFIPFDVALFRPSSIDC